MKKLVEIKNACKTYGSGDSLNKALDDVSLDIYEGEFLVILGSSGCGKSTLLNMIAGVDKLTSGSIVVDGLDITHASDRQLTNYRANYIGYVFQFFNLLNDLSVVSNVTLAPGANKDRETVRNLLRRLGLYEKRHYFPKQLSGGQQQRVSIARAMNKKSNLILCDEPTGALDYQSGKDVLGVIEEINQVDKKTVVFVTHTKEIAKMADRVIVMRSGKIIETYTNETKVSAKEVDW